MHPQEKAAPKCGLFQPETRYCMLVPSRVTRNEPCMARSATSMLTWRAISSTDSFVSETNHEIMLDTPCALQYTAAASDAAASCSTRRRARTSTCTWAGNSPRCGRSACSVAVTACGGCPHSGGYSSFVLSPRGKNTMRVIPPGRCRERVRIGSTTDRANCSLDRGSRRIPGGGNTAKVILGLMCMTVSLRKARN